jgi:DnaK suppressor protein
MRKDAHVSLMAIDVEQAEKLLLAKRDELVELQRISGQSQQAVELDQQSVGRLSRMDAIQQQAMAQAQERARRREQIMIDAALGRIRDGEYGYCAVCGEEIPEKRLALNPAAPHCVRCAG